MSDLSARLIDLSPTQRELLLQRLKEKGANIGVERKNGSTLIPRATRGDEIPLSFAQERLWFLYELDPHSALYNTAAQVRFRGPLNPNALEQSLNEIVRRHEALRTTFESVGGRPQQVIIPQLLIPLAVVDLTTLPEAVQQAEVQHWSMVEGRLPFDLARGPLVRAVLVRLSACDHVLFLVLHHIISDGWSISVLAREFAALYPTYAAGKSPSLSELSLQYADYAIWQRQWLQGEVLERQLAYWQQQLADIPPTLELPTDWPRPALPSNRGALLPFQITPQLTQLLQTLSQREGVTLFMTLLAAFKVLLYRYTGQSDLVVGTPIANRSRAEVEGLIGFFVNTLALRTQVKGDLSFKAMLQRVRKVALGAYAHQDLPFELLVEALQVERSLSHAPLFQVMFALQNTPQAILPLADLAISITEIDTETAKFDLILHIEEVGQGLQGAIEYSTDLFEAGTIEQLVSHFQALLTSIVADPEQRIADLSLLSPAEQQQLLVDWNATQTVYPREQCIHHLFQAQVTCTPEAIAVVYEDQHLSYAELNRRANQLAHYLQHLGVGPERLVGIAVERSLDMVIGLLGILKAGGAYLPLDPAYPQERLAFMLADGQVPVLLTHQPLLAQLPPHQAQVCCLDRDWPLISLEAMSNPESRTDARNLAYVMYTSGSTGRPKGISIAQRSIIRLVKDTTYASFDAEEVFLQFAPLAFDASTFEIWGPLLNGGRLVIFPAGTPTLEELGAWLQQNHVTTLWLTAGLFHQMIEHQLTDLKIVRQLLAGGDVLSVAHVAQVAHELPTVRLINGYGPTENTTFTCCYTLNPEKLPTHTVPIGRPIANTQVYVLDGRLQSVPVGVYGELCIGGDGLARGYLHRPELTAERFVPNPFSVEAGDRLYRTGDLVRYRPDGTLEFLGRLDHQVKIRGFRIELGEIESALRQHPVVREAAVVVHEVTPGDKRLVGYVAVGTEVSVTPTELRTYLQGQLPEYMVPAAWVLMEALPLTANGKLDRHTLPAPQLERGGGEGGAKQAPRTPTEDLLTNVWCRVLGLERVGRDDNFFELGGHSLLATQIVSRVRSAFQVDLRLQALFEYPTIAGLATQIEAAQHRALTLRQSPLQAVARQGELPLSFAQQRLWFLDQWEPESATYNIPAALFLRGHLDVAALEKSLNAIVQRHEALRTTFVSIDGQPRQVITPILTILLSVQDLQNFPESERADRARWLAEEEARHPFDLTQGPLLRASLLRLAPDEHVLLLTMHHIVSDGWSMGVLTRELTMLYAGAVTRQPETLAPLPVQYADYAVWQRQWLQGEVLEQQLAYWKQHLANVPWLDLPTDYPRPPLQTFPGRLQGFTLSTELTQALKHLAQEQQATLFMVLLGAFQVLLQRYTGQTQIVVGTPIANRQRSEIEGLIGFFVNTLALHTDLSGAPTFQEVLRRVREVALGAYAHQDVPFEMVVEALQPQRDLSRPPLFQVMFVLQNAPFSQPELPDLSVDMWEVENTTAKFDLTLSLSEMEGALAGTVEYNTDLFEPSTIGRLVEHYRALLTSILTDSEQSIADLAMLPVAERQQLLVDWNATQAAYPQAQYVPHLFEAQVARTPEAVAVLYEDQHLTYAELNCRANQLAHHLQQLGVGPEELVGIAVERSLEMVIGLWGILKAGGAYVPLDPTYPAERLAFMLANAQVPVLLTQSKLVPLLPATSARIIPLDGLRKELECFSTHQPEAGLSPASLAYTIYTSGSTGQPKGAMNTHNGLRNRLLWMQETYGLSVEDVVLQKTPFSFDVSVWEFFWPLLVGARLVVARPEGHKDPQYLVSTIVQHAVTTMHFVPSMLQALLDGAEVERCHSLRRVLCSGEALPGELQKHFFERSSTELHNLYGPTEAAIDVTYWACSPAQEVRSVPIGRPVANTQLYILDKQGQPVPIGIPGELYIGGVQVGRGYWRRPELTAERFVPDPFAVDRGQRLYRTGDLARYRADGAIEFLGRLDHQVKIRGFRIELGEIESVLAQHAGVREAVVVAREVNSGDKRLVGYVAVGAESSVTGEELRTHLRRQLPEYMVPTAWVMLETLPLSPNGKVDRRALPAPSWEAGTPARLTAAPRTLTQDLLVNLWKGVLGIEQIGSEDNFFELGGHSLLATQIISRVQSAFQVDLRLQALFETPTIAGLATQIEEAQRAALFLQLPPLQPGKRTGLLPLSFAQQRLWFLDQWEPNSPFYNIPAVLHLTGPLDLQALAQSLNAIVHRHEALRTTFVAQEGEPIQIIALIASVELPLVDLSELPEPDGQKLARQLAAEEAQHPFDLMYGPLLRASVLRLGTTEHVLVLNMHHIVSDGWSIGVLIRELAALYQGESTGHSVTLPELPVQYADYAVWQRQWLQGEVLEQQLAYWKQQLADVPPVLELPTDHPYPAVQTLRGALYSFWLEPAELLGLKELAQQEQVTLFMVLLGAFQVLLQRYTGQTQIVVGTPIANRQRSEIEGLIGFFVNTLALPTDLSGAPTFREVLRRVREVALGAYAHQDVPFEMVVEALQPQRDLSRTPLFQVMFVLQNAPWEIPELTGLTTQPWVVDSGTAKFDLTLSLSETDGALEGSFEYNTDLFEAATMARWASHFQTLLASILTDPEQRIADLAILSAVERQQLLVTWNATQTTYPREQCVPHLFEAQAVRTPEAVAVVYEDQHLTYAELNRRANQLAHHLHQRDLGPECIVGVCLERSPAMLLAWLGILKAGCAYLPLDPQYPAERLRFVLEDAGASLLITQQPLLDRLPVEEVPHICLDRCVSQLVQAPVDNPRLADHVQHLAYVIYTSGSTGQPKGVAIQHGSLLNLVFWHRRAFEVKTTDRVTQLAGPAFDASVWEVWPYLTAGASIHLPNEETRNQAPQLRDWLVMHDITLSFLPTPLAEAVLALAWPKKCGLRLLLTGGDYLHQAPPPGLPYKLINNYGPTENTVVTTSGNIFPEDQSGAAPSIGQPIANTQVYLLDENMQPVPVGVYGELCIGGDGLARGYLHRPELTAECFVPNPLGSEAGARLYRTGDLARYRSDGSIEFLGRLDHQVKIRGFRIELGEIETLLRQHPAVREAVVVVQEMTLGDKRLVGYVSVGAETALTTAELRAYLHEQLPEYMVPSVWVLMDTLPLTPNGKVDRRALPAPSLEYSRPGDTVSAPRTPIEELLVNLWQRVLGFEQIGIHDNFFALGGHSLLATQVISRVRNAFQVDLRLQALFEHPTIADLALRVEQVQRETLALKQPPLQAVTHAGELPLSFAQQRLWFLDQWEPESAAYNIPAALLLRGRLDVAAVEKSLNTIVQRHEALRTTFVFIDGQPAQVIAPVLAIPLSVRDLQDLPESERADQARRLAEVEAQHPFNLAQGPLLRAGLIRLAPDEHVLLLTMHHIVSDGWSMGVLTRELTTLYASAVKGQPDALFPLPLQYADYAVWQRQWLQGEVLEQQLAYWKQHLATVPWLDLPTDHSRPAVRTFRGRCQEFALSTEMAQALKHLAQEQQTTLFMLLLAAFKVLLYRYTGQPQIVVGSPIANRQRSEIEGLIGFFVNTLALHTDLSGKPSFREVLRRVREVALGAYAHQDVPFEMVVEALQPQRDLSHTPLFQVMFVLQNAPLDQLVLPDLVADMWKVENTTAKFDLTLSLAEADGALMGTLEYNTDLFEPSTIGRLVEHYRTLLASIITDSEQSIEDLVILPAAERQQLLVEWNATHATCSSEQCAHHLFEAQVARTPDTIAVVYEDQHLTYAELNRQANQLAGYLRQQGLEPESRVGVYLERSPQIVIAILGILKAGGAYVPLDPTYPPERLALIVQDALLQAIVTETQLEAEAINFGTCLVCLEHDRIASVPAWDAVDQWTENFSSHVTPDNLAYVIFTSGSTGRPKGIMIQHRSVANLATALDRTIYAQHSDALRITLNGSISFDTSVKQLIQLFKGYTLNIVPEEVRFDAPALLDLIKSQAVDVLDCTPSQLRTLIEEGLLQQMAGTALQVLVGGEAIDPVLWARLSETSSLNFYNVYGPTECTVDAILCAVHQSPDGPVLGRPGANTQIYVVDEGLRPVPIGVPGEICIGGVQVGRGYLNRPGLTAERFMPDPFGREPGGRLYRTGDLARYRADGAIEFLGRRDHQVKIRGFRIELGEIENVLRRHAGVREAVVVALETKPGDKCLVGYVAVGAESSVTSEELRTDLRGRLPEYMVPTVWVLLETLPLTSNGKVDRRALPAPEKPGLPAASALIAPRDSLELQLAHVWEDVLNVRPIGVTQSFFELGGHSLLAIRLMACLERELGLKVPVATLFQSSTIEQLAAVLRREDATIPLFSSLVPLQMGTRTKRPLFLIHPAGGSVWCYLNLVQFLDPTQPCYGLQAQGWEGTAEPLTSIEEMARHYLAEVQHTQPQGPYLLGGWSMGGVIAYEMAQQLRAQGQVVDELLLIDSYLPTESTNVEPDESELLITLALTLGLPWEALGAERQRFESLLGEERLITVLDHLKQAKVVPAEMPQAQFQQLLKVLSCHVQALQHYVPRAYEGAAVLFQSDQSTWAGQHFAEDSGWQTHLQGKLTVQTLPGNHYTLLRRPQVKNLAAQLQIFLENHTAA